MQTITKQFSSLRMYQNLIKGKILKVCIYIYFILFFYNLIYTLLCSNLLTRHDDKTKKFALLLGFNFKNVSHMFRVCDDKHATVRTVGFIYPDKIIVHGYALN